MSDDRKIHFPGTYQESVGQFRDLLLQVQKDWPDARLEYSAIAADEDLSIYWIQADPVRTAEKVLILTSGLHGIEGYVGAGMQDFLVSRCLSQLDPDTTGLLLVHPINPWGMKHRRRVNAANVDLNRNFLEDESDFQTDFNPDYRCFDSTLNPDRALRAPWLEISALLGKVLLNILRLGIKGLREAVLLGQRSNPRGLYYAGREYQPESRLMMDLFRETLAAYSEVLLIDLHTGYGPRYQMSLVNSPREKRSPEKLQEAFGYPLIVQADPEQFYSMKGDMINWLYQLQGQEYPERKLYGVAFEFGVHGESIPSEIKGLWTMIFENQVFRKGALESRHETWIRGKFQEMYYPSEQTWREKALADCRAAFLGVLRAEGYLRESDSSPAQESPP